MASAQQMVLGLYQVNNISTIPPTESNTAFSRANIFGLYLTLGFCLLAQPYGSLLYPRPKNILGRILFFFWRLNPVSATLEVVLLTIALVDGLIAFKERHILAEESIGPWMQLRTTATAIQFLRMYGVLPEHWRTLVQDAGGQSSSRPHSPISNHPTESPTGSDNLGYHDSNPTAMLPAPSVLDAGSPYSDHPSAIDSADIADHPNLSAQQSTLSSPQLGEDGSPLPSTPSEIEAGGSSTTHLPSITRSSRNRAEVVINIFSSLAVLLVLIKLCSITMPVHIRIPACLLVASWASIQVLHLVAHRRDMDLSNPTVVIRRALNLEATLRHWATWIILQTTTLPLFIYLTYVLIFQAKPVPREFELTELATFILFCLLINPLIYMSIKALIARSCCCFRRQRQEETCMERTKRCATEICKRSWWEESWILFIIIGVYNIVTSVYAFYFGMSLVSCIFHSPVSRSGLALVFSGMPILMEFWTFSPALPFKSASSREKRNSEWVSGVMLLSNLVVTGLFFAGVLLVYDERNSYNPEWLDWFGKLARLKREVWGQ